MRKYIIFLPHIIWAILCIVLKIVGLIGWWAATSFLWLPVFTYIGALSAIYGTALYGAKKKEEKEKKEKPTCNNCLYERVRKALNNEKCFGGEHEEPKVDGKCKYWIRSKS